MRKNCRTNYYGEEEVGVEGTLSRKITSTIVQSEDRKKAQRGKNETRYTDNRTETRRCDGDHDPIYSKVPVERTTSPDLRGKKGRHQSMQGGAGGTYIG